MRTPASDAQDNTRLRFAEAVIDKSGNAVASTKSVYTGNQLDRVMVKLSATPHREKMEWLHNEIELPSFTVSNADFSGVKPKQREGTVTADLDVANYAAKSGSRMFLPLNMLERKTYVPPADEQRSRPFSISYAFYVEDQVIYNMPQGYVIEAMPENVEMETSFARYNVSYSVEDQQIRYKRVLEFKVKEIEPALYNSYRSFMLDVVKADRAQAVLKAE